MFPPLPHRECERDPLDERELREEAFQSVLDKNAEAYDLFTTQPIVIFWGLISVAISVAGGIVGGVLYGSEGAFAGIAIAMSAVVG